MALYDIFHFQCFKLESFHIKFIFKIAKQVPHDRYVHYDFYLTVFVATFCSTFVSIVKLNMLGKRKGLFSQNTNNNKQEGKD